MSIAQGTRLGPYEIVAPLGAGGMGEVYRARDTRLDRTVAIKVLPERLSSSEEVRQRFEREARTISQLSHPHICALYDVGREGETEYLVMELLEGETLSDRLGKGPLSLEQTLRYGVEMAGALDRAHRQGIVHRDLKPGNVMLTRSGVKLLDFGLAKVMAPGVSQSSLTAFPTQANLTQEGTILGTFQYMAPEQLEGKEADARTDIFALGAVLYEMATGRKAFEGSSQASLISAIMSSDPQPISSLQPMSPAALDRLVRLCLAKAPDDRWQSAHDVGVQLAEMAQSGPAGSGTSSIPARRPARFAPIAAVLLAGGLGWAAGRYLRPAAVPARGARRLPVPPPEKTTLVLQETPALSPDGRLLAFVALDSSGKSLLYVRALDSVDAVPLSDTDSPSMPFWSPDSRSLGFFAKGKLKTIAVSGGRSQTLCDAAVPRGGTWNRDGMILFVPSPPEPPHVVPASGGEARPASSLAGTTGQSPFRRSPYFLPDGRHYLYLEYLRGSEDRSISVGSLDSRETKRLVKSQTSAAYAPPGYLVFRRETALVAQRFDAKTLTLRGDPFPIVPEIGFNPITLHALFSVAEDGTLTYVAAGGAKTQLTWFARDGKEIGSVGGIGYYNSLSLSPDGKRVAFDQASENGDLDIRTLDLERRVPSRFTFTPATEFFPLWSPDGNRIVFSSLRGGPPNLYQKVTSGAGAEELLWKSVRPNLPTSWSADGRYLVFASLDPKTKWDLWVLPFFGDRQPFPFAQTAFDEVTADVSPDGRWLAYASNESGTFEVYVRPFPSGPGKWQVSRDGGYESRWRRDGKELFYLAADRRLVGVEVKTDAQAFEAGSSTALFRARLTGIETQNAWGRYAVSADGQRFLLNTIREDWSATPITVALDWQAGAPR